MISTLLLYLGMGVGLLTLLDMFLSNDQKATIERWSIAMWHWIDSVKRLSFMNWFRRRGPRNLVPIVASFLIVIAFLGLHEIGLVLLYGVVGAIVARLLLELLLRARTRRGFVLRASISLVVPAIPVALFILFIQTIDPDSGFWAINLVIVIVLTLFISLAFAFWVIAMLPFVIAVVATIGLSVAEFVARRIAEYPKGPILAASAIFTAAIAIFKIFGGTN